VIEQAYFPGNACVYCGAKRFLSRRMRMRHLHEKHGFDFPRGGDHRSKQYRDKLLKSMLVPLVTPQHQQQPPVREVTHRNSAQNDEHDYRGQRDQSHSYSHTLPSAASNTRPTS
jgi:hypothetical protein